MGEMMKKSFMVILFALLFTNLIFSQIPQITQFPAQDISVAHLHSSIIELDNDELLMIWIESSQLKVSYSSNGVNWTGSKAILSDLPGNIYLQDLATYKTNSGKVLIAYRINSDTTQYNLITSTDNGLNWSQPSLLIKDVLSNSSPSWDVKFSQTDDDKLWFTFSRTINLEYMTSEDDGVTWSNKALLIAYAKDGNIFSVGDSLMFIFERRNRILYKTSRDSGTTWSSIDTIDFENKYNNEPSVVKKSDGSLMLIFRTSNSTIFGDYYFTESFDNGKTWLPLTQFTKYVGTDTRLKINTNSEKLYASFVSERSFNEYGFTEKEMVYTIWYGIVGVSDDRFTPPVINEISYLPESPSALDTLIITAKIFDDESVTNVYLKHKLNDVEQPYIAMFDDGLHHDGLPNDSVYGATIDSMNSNDLLLYSIAAEDNIPYVAERFGDTIFVSIPYTYDRYLIDINRFKLPLNNSGILADVKVNEYSPGGRFDSNSVLFSGGFWLSGYDNNELWANAMFSTSRLEHYLPGMVGSDVNDIHNKIYVLHSSDEPFGISWQSWKNAVAVGAKFYDGDGDGVYKPVDLNNNGIWDENEDRPDLIGDITTWTIFNDGKSEDMRVSFEVPPKDIEIKQTVFAYAPNTHEELDGIMFIRYNIENKNTETYDSVYFTIITDPDVGNYVNDLAGCDTTLNSGFTYDEGYDEEFGDNSPTFMMTLLQGAPVYIPGETFIDNNNNGIYDEGTDTPLDTAYFKYGDILNEEEFPGAKNQYMTSFMHYMSSHPTMGDPDNPEQLRYYQLGLRPNGKKVDPCNWEFSDVFNVNCSDVNPYFMYSGNPVTQNGWINTVKNDQRILINNGPYTLEPNKPIEIIAAYVVGRGNTSLESINVTKKLAKNALGFYSTNFTYVPVGVTQKPKNQFPTKFSLSQNYPNPFNPSTTIKYSIPRSTEYYSVQQTTLKIYDVLGREVATLVNERQKPGNYEVKFNATNLVSGVYLYQLKAGSFTESKKMLLLK